MADRRGQLQELQEGRRGAQPQGRHLVGRREAVRERGPDGGAHGQFYQRLPAGRDGIRVSFKNLDETEKPVFRRKKKLQN